jgi:hypothetical protein
MKKHVELAIETLRVQLRVFPALTWAGLLGLAFGAACAIMAAARGRAIPPEGDLLDTATFNGAVGVFILTLSALAPGVRWQRNRGRTWARLLAFFTIYGYGVETVQAFRGLDPRFSRLAGPADQLAGLIFFLFALSIMVCSGILALKYFRAEASPMNLAVRYGALASAVGFLVGIWMSVVTQGRLVPEAGNLLVAHAAGFHGIQVIPVVAFLLQWSAMSRAAVRALVHLAGAAWVGACFALAWQSLSGHAAFELTPGSFAAAVCFAVFGLTAAAAATGAWLRTEASGAAGR